MEGIIVAITTHNRPKLFKKCFESWQKHLPQGAKLFVVDDASDTPYCEADYRFEENVGVAVAKNKCIELAHNNNFSHLFLVDDDVICKSPDWYKPYVESGEDHLQYIFPVGSKWKDLKLKEIGRAGGIIGYNNTKGTLLYLTRKCVETIGFMRKFGRFGGEHRDYSIRAHKAGLSTFMFGDVVDSSRYFYALDALVTHRSSLPPNIREHHLREANIKQRNSRHLPLFEPYT